ncbi:hypothetical protein QA596_03920 [Balneolales bacterium ANBcel1]|nr:hypothetical protein [Balneolales bacterium ANBcel1]
MKLNIISGSKQSKPALAKIYKNGTLALNIVTRQKLSITQANNYHLALATDQTHKLDEKLYLVFMDKPGDATRKLLVTEKNATVNFAHVFDAQNIDYEKTAHVYELEKQITWQGNLVAVFQRTR